jgi:aminoglycoside/choline kinase family phosphotransferase
MNLPDVDPRFHLLAEWLAKVLHSQAFALAPASEDASFRRYFRVTLEASHALAPGAQTLIAMDAPPPREDCRPFVHVAALMHAAGVHAPKVVAQDIERGFLLLTDLGPTTYLRALDADNANELFRDATGGAASV